MHPPIAILATDACSLGPGHQCVPGRHSPAPGGCGGDRRAAQRIAKPTVFACSFAAMARGTQRLPAAAIPKYSLVTAMRVDVVDDVCCTDYAVVSAVTAQWVRAQEGQSLPPPASRAIEGTGYWITVAGVVAVLLGLIAPPDRAMDRWTNGHEIALDDGGVGHKGNARMGENLGHEVHPGPLPISAQHHAGSYLDPLGGTRNHLEAARSG